MFKGRREVGKKEVVLGTSSEQILREQALKLSFPDFSHLILSFIILKLFLRVGQKTQINN
jgi:hypothetical protein